jgi:hypothetical protein
MSRITFNVIVWDRTRELEEVYETKMMLEASFSGPMAEEESRRNFESLKQKLGSGYSIHLGRVASSSVSSTLDEVDAFYNR